jgi:hypothetical protein
MQSMTRLPTADAMVMEWGSPVPLPVWVLPIGST